MKDSDVNAQIASICEGEYARGIRDGMDEMLRIVRKISASKTDGSIPPEVLKEKFESDDLFTIMNNFSGSEIGEKIITWENDIHVGDIVQSIAKVKAVVTKVGEEECSVVFGDGSAGTIPNRGLRKVGGHINVESFLSQIGDE